MKKNDESQNAEKMKVDRENQEDEKNDEDGESEARAQSNAA